MTTLPPSLARPPQDTHVSPPSPLYSRISRIWIWIQLSLSSRLISLVGILHVQDSIVTVHNNRQLESEFKSREVTFVKSVYFSVCFAFVCEQ